MTIAELLHQRGLAGHRITRSPFARADVLLDEGLDLKVGGLHQSGAFKSGRGQWTDKWTGKWPDKWTSNAGKLIVISLPLLTQVV